jgi:hypothetical protein
MKYVKRYFSCISSCRNNCNGIGIVAFMNKITISVMISCGCAFSAAVQGTSLEELITSMYGGDGIQLVTSSNEFSHAPHFQDDALQELNQLTQGALESKLPTPSTSSGVVYQYNAFLNDFVQSRESLGPIFVEQANTLGRGNVMFGFSFSNANWSRYKDHNLRNINLVLDHEDIAAPGSDICIGGPENACYLFEEDDIHLLLDIDFTTKGLFFFSSYGLTDNWDIGVMVPILRNTLAVSSTAMIHEHESSQYFSGTLHEFDETGSNGDKSTDSVQGSKTDIGDIQIFSKYNLLSEQYHQLALSFSARLATGDKANLMGFDNYGFKTSILSSHSFSLGETPLKLHLNLGYEINAGVLGQDEIDYSLALEQPITWGESLLAMSYEILGEKDINENKDTTIDAAISVKWSQNDLGVFSFSGRVPLNNEGLRSDFIYAIGYEVYF